VVGRSPLTRLDHVYWLGGGTVAGKSTVARRLAERHGLRRYATDDAMAAHAGRSVAADAPLLSAFLAMDMDERWVNRSPETMLATFHWFHGEGFELIVEDLLQLPPEPAVIVEGFRLLPRLVAPLLTAPGHAVWLLPTPEFREVSARRRGSGWEFLDRTRDPVRARANLLERDRLFTEWLAVEAARLHLPVIEVHPELGEEELVGQVTRVLRL
jgi:hypothetical protein